MERPYQVVYSVARGGRRYSGTRQFRKASQARQLVESVRQQHGTAALHDNRKAVYDELRQLYRLAAESAALWRDVEHGETRTLCAVAEAAALKRIAELRGLRGLIEAII